LETIERVEGREAEEDASRGVELVRRKVRARGGQDSLCKKSVDRAEVATVGDIRVDATRVSESLCSEERKRNELTMRWMRIDLLIRHGRWIRCRMRVHGGRRCW